MAMNTMRHLIVAALLAVLPLSAAPGSALTGDAAPRPNGAWVKPERVTDPTTLVGPLAEQAKLIAADGDTFDGLGGSVALAGDVAVVGAPGADADANSSQGAAYVFARSNGLWSEQAKLTSAEGATDDRFGFAVALDGDSALVGAPFSNVDGSSNQGAAYVFTRSNGAWSEQATLVADDGAAFDLFGRSVALAGDVALVGAPDSIVDGNLSQGAAYVFTRSNGVWSQQAKLVADDGAQSDDFGHAVALSGDSALVGAPFAQVGDNSVQGAVYVFVREGDAWSQQAKLTAADGTLGSVFGVSVALRGGSALVGAPGLVAVNILGSAYVFARSDGAWSQRARLTAADGAAGDGFGASVTLAGDSALVGATGADVGATVDQGAAYVFGRSDEVWSQRAKLIADDGATGDGFGVAAALAGDTALVGATGADVGATVDQGAAYVYVPPSVPASLAVDFIPLASDGNDVFEPGEGVDVAPAWRNDAVASRSLTGSASSFTGPAGPTYALVSDEADYGELGPQETASCSAVSGECFAVGVDSGPRPARHWDATVDETLSDGTTQTWALHLGDSFADLLRTNPFYRSVETLFHHRVTQGCEGTDYCPGAPVSRGQMAVFVLRAKEGPGFVPPACIEGGEAFFDVPAEHPFCPWIEELFRRGALSGCGDGNYCPGAPVTRAHKAVFLLKSLEGGSYVPPTCSGRFTDVTCPSLFADWIEDLFGRGITSGCDTSPPRYCPGDEITRGQAAALQVRTFDLRLYEP